VTWRPSEVAVDPCRIEDETRASPGDPEGPARFSSVLTIGRSEPLPGAVAGRPSRTCKRGAVAPPAPGDGITRGIYQDMTSGKRYTHAQGKINTPARARAQSRYLSRVWVRVALGTAPITVSSFFPSLKIITVGMERMPYSLATLGDSSVLSLTCTGGRGGQARGQGQGRAWGGGGRGAATPRGCRRWRSSPRTTVPKVIIDPSTRRISPPGPRARRRRRIWAQSARVPGDGSFAAPSRLRSSPHSPRGRRDGGLVLTTLTRSPYSSEISSTRGAIMRQGPHQGAQ